MTKRIDGYQVGFWVTAAIIVIALLSCKAFGGDIRQAACRVSVDGDAGSGALIDVLPDRSRGTVLTCAHVFDRAPGGKILVTMASGRQHYGRLLGKDRRADLALISIMQPAVEPVSVSTDDTGPLKMCGFGSARIYREIRGQRITERNSRSYVEGMDLILISGKTEPGDSGCAVINSGGSLVAVQWGSREGVSYASSGGILRRFLGRMLGPRLTQVCTPGGYCQPSRQVYQRPIQSAPVTDRTNQLTELRDEIGRKNAEFLTRQAERDRQLTEIIESNNRLIDEIRSGITSQPEAATPAAQGPAGPQGEPGKDATIDIDALAAKVLQRMPPRRVERIVDGKVVASGVLQPGDTLQIIDSTKQ